LVELAFEKRIKVMLTRDEKHFILILLLYIVNAIRIQLFVYHKI
jgi:hypothetical protein